MKRGDGGMLESGACLLGLKWDSFTERLTSVNKDR